MTEPTFPQRTLFVECDEIPIAVIDNGKKFTVLAYDIDPPRRVSLQFVESEGVRITHSRFIQLLNRCQMQRGA